MCLLPLVRLYVTFGLLINIITFPGGNEYLKMVYVSSWQEYQEAAETLYTKAPNKVCLDSLPLTQLQRSEMHLH